MTRPGTLEAPADPKLGDVWNPNPDRDPEGAFSLIRVRVLCANCDSAFETWMTQRGFKLLGVDSETLIPGRSICSPCTLREETVATRKGLEARVDQTIDSIQKAPSRNRRRRSMTFLIATLRELRDTYELGAKRRAAIEEQIANLQAGLEG